MTKQMVSCKSIIVQPMEVYTLLYVCYTFLSFVRLPSGEHGIQSSTISLGSSSYSMCRFSFGQTRSKQSSKTLPNRQTMKTSSLLFLSDPDLMENLIDTNPSEVSVYYGNAITLLPVLNFQRIYLVTISLTRKKTINRTIQNLMKEGRQGLGW